MAMDDKEKEGILRTSMFCITNWRSVNYACKSLICLFKNSSLYSCDCLEDLLYPVEHCPDG